MARTTLLPPPGSRKECAGIATSSVVARPRDSESHSGPDRILKRASVGAGLPMEPTSNVGSVERRAGQTVDARRAHRRALWDCRRSFPFWSEAYTDLNYGRPVMAHLNVYVFRCSRCGEPAVSLFKERTPGSTEPKTRSFLRLITNRFVLNVPPASTPSFAMRRTRLITSCWTGTSR